MIYFLIKKTIFISIEDWNGLNQNLGLKSKKTETKKDRKSRDCDRLILHTTGGRNSEDLGRTDDSKRFSCSYL